MFIRMVRMEWILIFHGCVQKQLAISSCNDFVGTLRQKSDGERREPIGFQKLILKWCKDQDAFLWLSADPLSFEFLRI